METKAMIKKKLTNRVGESIAETLVALLILTLAVTMLAGSVVSAAKVNRQTKDLNVEFTTVDESRSTNLSVSDATAVIKHDSVAASDTNVEVQVSTTKDDNQYSFFQSGN